MPDYPVTQATSWEEVAKQQGVTVDQLKDWNPGVNLLLPGTSLKINNKSDYYGTLNVGREFIGNAGELTFQRSLLTNPGQGGSPLFQPKFNYKFNNGMSASNATAANMAQGGSPLAGNYEMASDYTQQAAYWQARHNASMAQFGQGSKSTVAPQYGQRAPTQPTGATASIDGSQGTGRNNPNAGKTPAGPQSLGTVANVRLVDYVTTRDLLQTNPYQALAQGYMLGYNDIVHEARMMLFGEDPTWQDPAASNEDPNKGQALSQWTLKHSAYWKRRMEKLNRQRGKSQEAQGTPNLSGVGSFDWRI